MLLDQSSFVEVGALVRQPNDPDALYGDGVVTGHGAIDGRPVAVIAHDQTVFGGSVGEMFGRKVAAAMEFAATVGCPLHRHQRLRRRAGCRTRRPRWPGTRR